MRNGILILLLTLVPMSVMAEVDDDSVEYARATTKRKPLPYRLLMGLKEFVDSSAVSGLDPLYVGQPKLPWSAELRTDINNSMLSMTAKDHDVEGIDSWNASTHSGPTVSIGAWAGYRGYGFGLSWAIGAADNKSFSIGATGGSYGVNLRIKQFRSHKPKVDMNGSDDYNWDNMDIEADDPIKARSLFLDAYYMFNRKRFSYAAAYDQSLQQLRSAGSPVVGAMYYHTRVAFDNLSNFALQVLLNDVGKIKFTQASVGAGYAYNWVPARGWLVSAMAVPMLTYYNRMHVYTYDIDISEDMKDIRVVEKNHERINNRVSWNFDTRLAISYQWQRYYVRAYSHYNQFRYRNKSDYGYTSDWTVYSAFGVRF